MCERLSSSRKRPRGSLVASTDLPSICSRLLTIQDPVSRLIYPIDTGAEVSVMPPRPEDRCHSPDKVQLKTANGSSIQTFGRRSVKVELGLANDIDMPRHCQDSYRYAIRTVRVFTYAIWFKECCTDVSTFYGQCVS